MYTTVGGGGGGVRVFVVVHVHLPLCRRHLPVCVCGVLALLLPPFRLQPSRQGEWQTVLQAGEVSTTNSLKHTTDIKDDEQRKNMEGKSSVGGSRAESSRKCQKTLVADQIKVRTT